MKLSGGIAIVAFLVLIAPYADAGTWPAKIAVECQNTEGRPEVRIPFFDGIKLQTSNCNPKLTYANHVIKRINKLTGTSLPDWDSLLIQSLEVVLWKDLSRYFKADFAFGGSTGSLLGSSTALQRTPFDFGIRMRQRYAAFEMWTNLYFYPLTTTYKPFSRSERLYEPFVAAGLGYTFFRSEVVFKVRKTNMFYDRLRSNWNEGYWGFKIMTGFNINLGKISPGLDKWLITCSAYQIWNRLKGHARMHLTDGLKLYGRQVHVDIRARTRMDIDLTGQYYSIAVGRYF